MAKLKDLKQVLLDEGIKVRVLKSDKELQQQGARAFMMIIEREGCPYRRPTEERERKLWMMGWKKASEDWLWRQRKSREEHRG